MDWGGGGGQTIERRGRECLVTIASNPWPMLAGPIGLHTCMCFSGCLDKL